ncbi:hypothetical protein MKW98_021840, partial [Papaver atlanticum]
GTFFHPGKGKASPKQGRTQLRTDARFSGRHTKINGCEYWFKKAWQKHRQVQEEEEKALPANGKIAKDSKETVQECVSEFISFITSEASDKCQKEKRKTINGDDLLWAMATLGFEDYIDPLKVYLSRYREMEGDTKGSAKGGDGSAKKDGAGVQNGHIF